MAITAPPSVATGELLAVLRALEPVRTSLALEAAGAHQGVAIELAEAVEVVGREIDLLRLVVAKAVNEAAPAPTGASALVDHGAPRAAEDHCGKNDAEADSVASPYRRGRDALRVRCRISGAEAARRITLAHRVLPRTTFTGEVVPPLNEHLGAVIDRVGGESARHILRAVRRIRVVAGIDQADEIEATLAAKALTFDADAMGVMADRSIALLDPDGPPPRESVQHLGAYIGQTRNGLTTIRLVVGQADRELLETIFDTGTNPRSTVAPRATAAPDAAPADTAIGAEPASSDAPDLTPALTPDLTPELTPPLTPADAEAVNGDTRPRHRRMLDALIAAAGAALRVGDLPRIGGMPPQVIVTMQLGDLLRGIAPGRQGDRVRHPAPAARALAPAPGDLAAPAAGVALLPHAGPVPLRSVRRLACDADVIPVVLGTQGQVLDVGRRHRLVPEWMRYALIARDHGCAFPGCPVPATWCEAHHILSWLGGGATSIDNSVLLCAYHHHLVHDQDWTISTQGSTIRFRPPWSSLPEYTSNPMHSGIGPGGASAPAAPD